MASQNEWKSYFSSHKGHGLLATADSNGKTNIAVYARPHVQDDGRWGFIMNERRSFGYVSQNPYATYAFDEGGSRGHRVYLERDEILSEGELYEAVISESRKPASVPDSGLRKYVVFFKVTEVRPLVGG